MGKKSVFAGLIFVAIHFQSFSQNHQLARSDNLQHVMEDCRGDSVKLLERLSAIRFHQLLNEYRVEKGLNPVAWNEHLWLAARNHAIYLGLEGEFAHEQNRTTSRYFTGTRPGDRLRYVFDGRGMWWNGENIHSHTMYSKKDWNEKIESIALRSLNSWKGSPGHNRNMLTKGHTIHAVAMIVSEGRVIAVSMFGASRRNIKSTKYPYFDIDTGLLELINRKPIYKDNGLMHYVHSNPDLCSDLLSDYIDHYKNKVSVGTQKKTLEQDFYSKVLGFSKKDKWRQDKVLRTAAKKHVSYMAANNVETSEESKQEKKFYGKTVANRVARSAGKLFWFWTKHTDAQEFALRIEYNSEVLFTALVNQDIFEKLIVANSIEISAINSFGYSFKVKRRDGKLRIYVVLLVQE